jgi:hypothetical protein
MAKTMIGPWPIDGECRALEAPLEWARTAVRRRGHILYWNPREGGRWLPARRLPGS